MVSREKIITGNWKMHKTIDEAIHFINAFDIAPSNLTICLAVPFTMIKPLSEVANQKNIIVGAQNMNDATEGAFTGEIAGKMLVDAGAKFVLLGHSERRHIFNETNAFINRKIKRALTDGLRPVLCVGETLSEKDAGKAQEIIQSQLSECLSDLSKDEVKKIVIAYEPVWAIGTGKTATAKDAETMHCFIRECLKKLYDNKIASLIPIQYGGSVKPENAKELMDQPNIDGLLIGGASLSIDSFKQIIHNVE